MRHGVGSFTTSALPRVEGDVHHASARRFRELMTQAGLQAIAQRVFRGPAPFLITEAIAAEPVPVVPRPTFGCPIQIRLTRHHSIDCLATE